MDQQECERIKDGWEGEFWKDPEKVLFLIDLIFMGEDGKVIPS